MPKPQPESPPQRLKVRGLSEDPNPNVSAEAQRLFKASRQPLWGPSVGSTLVKSLFFLPESLILVIVKAPILWQCSRGGEKNGSFPFISCRFGTAKLSDVLRRCKVNREPCVIARKPTRAYKVDSLNVCIVELEPLYTKSSHPWTPPTGKSKAQALSPM